MRSSFRVFTPVLLLALSITSSRAVRSQQPVSPEALYPTRGNATSAVATKSGRYVFVSVTNVGAPNYQGSDAAAGARTDAVSGIEIFRSQGKSGHRLKLVSVGFVRTGSTGANGLVLLRGERTLAVGVGDAGVAFLDVRAMLRGQASPVFAAQGPSAGTFDVVATRDGRYVFSSNEYGVIDGQRGNVGVIRTNLDSMGRVVHPETLSRIPLGDVAPSLALSPDDSRLYVATELVPAVRAPAIAGSPDPVLTRNDCVQKQGTPARANGFISVLDVARITAGLPDAVLTRVAAGCSPVRLTESADSSALFVSARGSDTILRFDAHLLESNPDHSLLQAYPSGGAAPVGVRLFANGRYLAVANSNRFAEGDGNLAILDVQGNSVRKLPFVLPAGAFPRNLSLSGDGKTIYLTNYKSRNLQLVNVP